MTTAVVVGTGFGARIHVPALRMAGFDVVALVGQDRERTARRAARCGVRRAYTSLAEALALDPVDAVTVATPPDTHAALVIEACAAGRHVVCEKPFAIDRHEADRMLAAAERAGITHLVGHEFRWSPGRALAARVIASGLVGEPRMFSIVQYVPLVADPAARMPSWWFDEARGGGWLGASGSHAVDQVRTWFGEIARVSAALVRVSARAAGAEDGFVARITTASGVEGVLQQTAAAWTPRVASVAIVAGTEGTVEVDGDTVWLSDRSGRRVLDVPSDLRLPPGPAPSDDPRDQFTHLELGPYARLCAVLRAGAERRPIDSAVAPPTFADGLACMRVLDAIRASAAAGGTCVDVPTG